MKKTIFIVCVLILLLMFYDFVPQSELPERVQSNQIIDQPGYYGSPASERTVRVGSESEGQLNFKFARLTHPVSQGEQDNTISSGSESKHTLAKNSNWFMCWDSQDRLWAFIPEANKNLCACYYANDDGTGICEVGINGGWEGVPEQFLAKLPEDVKEKYQKYQNDRQTHLE